MLDLNVIVSLLQGCKIFTSTTELLMLITIFVYKFIRPKTTVIEVCVETLRNKHLQDNNSDRTECSTLVGTNNEPNKIKAINYSRSDKVTIIYNGTTPNSLCYSKILNYIVTEKWETRSMIMKQTKLTAVSQNKVKNRIEHKLK